MPDGDDQTSAIIQRMMGQASKMTIMGWFAGLAWFAFTTDDTGLGALGWILLIVVGMFAASIIFGSGVAMILAGLNKLITGSMYEPKNLPLYAWGAFISPVVAFFCAGPVARFTAQSFPF